MAKEGKIRAVLKDWDDHVVETYPFCSLQIISFAERSGRRVPNIDEVRRAWGEPLQKMFGKLWEIGNTEGVVSEYIRGFPEDFCSPPLPGAFNAIERLKKMGFVLGVVTSSPRRAVERTLRNHPELPFELIDFMHTAEDVAYHKPDPRVFDMAFVELSKHGIKSPGAVLYSGDGVKDFLAAQGRGIRFVGVLTGTTSQEEFLDNGLDKRFIIPSIRELPEKVDEINRG